MTEFMMQKAREMFLKDHHHILHQVGILPPSLNQDPLNPPWSCIEYEAMERDTSKYFLYYAAISLALKDIKARIKKAHSVQHVSVNCMVVGAGRGRLVDYCLDCFSELKLLGSIYVIEANHMAHSFLQEKFKDVEAVKVIKPIIIRNEPELRLAIKLNACDKYLSDLAIHKPINFFVSELFGSFGDNEFVSEILTTCVNIFGSSNCLSVPKSYSTYICAVHSSSLNSYFSSRSRGMYVLGLPKDTVMLSELHLVYSCKCTEKQEKLSSSVKIPLRKYTSATSISGLAGYFRACLYGDIMIDTTPTATQNTYFWETAFFTLHLTLSRELLTQTDAIILNISRTCQDLIPSYEHIGRSDKPLLKVCYKWTLQNSIFLSFEYSDNENASKVYNHFLSL